MEIFFAILAAIFAVISSVFGVRSRLRSSSSRTGSNLRNEGSGYNDLVSDCERCERDKERLQELDRRDDANIKRCSEISERIRKREPETDVTE